MNVVLREAHTVFFLGAKSYSIIYFLSVVDVFEVLQRQSAKTVRIEHRTVARHLPSQNAEYMQQHATTCTNIHARTGP
jgi:hypothetical protein